MCTCWLTRLRSLETRLVTILPDGRKVRQGSLRGICARGSPGASPSRAVQTSLLSYHLEYLVLQPLPTLSTSPILTKGVLLGTFSGTRAGLSPEAQMDHAQNCAPGSASFSQKWGLGSRSLPCGGSGSLILQPARRANTVQQNSDKRDWRDWEGQRAALRAQKREAERKGEEEDLSGPLSALGASIRGWARRLAYLGCSAPRPSRSEGCGPRDLLLAKPAGRIWGPSPAPSLSSLLPAAVRCQIPAPASPDPGVGPRAPPPRPTFQGSPGRSTLRIRSPLAGLGPLRWGLDFGRRPQEAE